jgi:hypothetical protein
MNKKLESSLSNAESIFVKTKDGWIEVIELKESDGKKWKVRWRKQ